MVGEEEVTELNNNNALREGAGEIAPLKPNGYFERYPHRGLCSRAVSVRP